MVSLLTNFPIRHCPSIGHPIRNVSAPVPCPLRRRDRIKVGIGCVLGRRKAAGLLSHFEAESWEAASELAYVAGSNGLLDSRCNRRSMFLAVVEDLVVAGGAHGRILLWDRVLGFLIQARDGPFNAVHASILLPNAEISEKQESEKFST